MTKPAKRVPGDGPVPPSPQEGLAGEAPRARELQPWQRPPFEPGNQLGVIHGAYSAALVEQTAEEVWADIEEQLQQMPGYLAVDRILIEELREIVSQLVLLRNHRREKGLLDAKGDPRSYWPLEDKLSRRLLDYSKALGLGSAERAKVFGNLMAGSRAFAEAEAARQRITQKLTTGASKRRVNKPPRKTEHRPNSAATRKGS